MVARALLTGVAALGLFACAAPRPPAPPPFLAPSAPVAPAPSPDAPAVVGAKAEAGATADALAEDASEALDDDPEDDGDAASSPAGPATRPLALDLDDGAFARALRDAPATLGPMSIGRPSAGLLVNGVQMPEGAGWRLVDRAHAWGTQETVDAIAQAIGRVQGRFAETQPLSIGHLSSAHGGPLSPHKSHQSGRDADIGYYYTVKSPWFARATGANLDRARTWALVKAFAEGEVEMILVDTSVQKLLRDWALSHGEDRELVDRLIQVGSKSPRTLVRHVPGHATHLHVRFWSPAARAVGERAEPHYQAELASALAAQTATHESQHQSRSKGAPASAQKSQPPFFEHRVHDGDTLYRLAHRYGTTVEAIQRANGLKGFALKPKTVLRIPKG